MKTTGNASRTELRRSRWSRRPGSFPGRSCAVALVVALLIAPAGAAAQEIFSWLNRGLAPVEFVAGDWVRYQASVTDENGQVTDTLTVRVLHVFDHVFDHVVDQGIEQGIGQEVWLGLETSSGLDYIALDPEQLDPGRQILDALLRVVRMTDAGLVEEDVEALKRSALVQRHFTDPFVAPNVERHALPDSVVGGEAIGREAVLLDETLSESAGVFVIRTRLRARAEMSPAIPLLGLLRSQTNSVVTTEAADGGRDRRRPALFTQTSLLCIGYGRDGESALPEGIESAN